MAARTSTCDVRRVQAATRRRRQSVQARSSGPGPPDVRLQAFKLLAHRSRWDGRTVAVDASLEGATRRSSSLSRPDG